MSHKIFSVGFLFFYLLCGSTSAEVIVLTDGSRLDVLNYQVKDKVVVFEITEGKLRSLPLTYVDVEATGRANHRTAIEPETESPTSVVHPPDGHDELAKRVLELYGIEDLVIQLVDEVHEQKDGVLGTESMGETSVVVREAFEESFSAEDIYRNVRKAFAGAADERDLRAWLEHLQSPLHQRMTELEEAANRPEASESFQQYIQTLETIPPPSGRLELVGRFEEAVGLSDLMIESIAAFVESMMTSSQPASVDSGSLEGDVDSFREQYAVPLRDLTRKGMLFMYRTVDDEELEEYVTYWETEEGRRLNRLVKLSFQEGFGVAGRVMGHALVKTAEEIRAQKASIPAPPAQVYDELNFRFTPPNGPWVPLDVETVNKDATLGFSLQNPSVLFMIIAESGGTQNVGLSNEGAAAIVRSNLEDSAGSCRHLREAPHSINGMEGILLESEVIRDNKPYSYIKWVYTTNGFIYQLMLSAATGEPGQETFQALAHDVFRGFQLIAPNRISSKPSGNLLGDYASDRYGYRIRLDGSGWTSWPNLAEQYPEADFGGFYGAGSAFAVVAVSLQGLEPDLDVLTPALLETLEVSLTEDRLTNRQELREEGFFGQSFDFERNVDGTDFVYRAQIRRGDHIAYLLVAWTLASEQNSNLQILDDWLGRVTIDPSHEGITSPAALPERDRLAHAALFNSMGLYHYDYERFRESAEYLETAFSFQNSNATIFENMMSALTFTGRFEEAYQYLDDHLGRFRDHLSIRSYSPFLKARLGRKEEALNDYASLFAAGYQNDYDLKDYVELLWEMDRRDRAQTTLANYRRGHDSLFVTRLAAELHRRAGEYDEALLLLQDRRGRSAFNLELTLDLADVYYDAERYKESLTLVAETLQLGHETAEVYFCKGRSELALGSYRDAKTSMQSALDRNPGDSLAREYLDYISGQLGEGSQEGVRHPIEPVAFPDALRASAASATQTQSDHGAIYENRVSAVHYKKGETYKQTEFIRIKIHKPEAVSALNTLRFSFDPLDERIFVNALRVLDEEGRVQSTGDVSDFYVLDEGTSESASQDQTLSLPVAGLAPGATIEVTITTLRKSPPEKMPFVRYSLSSSYPVLRSNLFVSGDVSDVIYRSVNLPEPQKSNETILWTAENPPLYRSESLAADVNLFLPIVWVGDQSNTWESVAKDYLNSIHDRLDTSPQIKVLAGDLLGKESEAGIEAIASYVQERFTYKGIAFGHRAWLPNRAEDIVRNRYGDCKDHSLLFYQLLRAADVPAHLALVNVSADIQTEIPSLDQFDHMIVFAPTYDGGHFFDLTDKNHDISKLPPMGLGGKQALVLDPAEPALIQIPDYPLDSSTVTSERTLRVIGESDIEVEETLTLSGYYSAYMRSFLKGSDSAGRLRQIQDVMAGSAQVLVRSVDAERLDTPNHEVILKLRYLVKGAFHPLENRIIGRLPAIWEREFLAVDYQENRQTPYQIEYPLTVQTKVMLEPPEGYCIGSALPAKEQEQTSYSQWNVEIENAPKEMLIRYSNVRPRAQGSPSEYGALAESLGRALDALERSVVFVKSQQAGLSDPSSAPK